MALLRVCIVAVIFVGVGWPLTRCVGHVAIQRCALALTATGLVAAVGATIAVGFQIAFVPSVVVAWVAIFAISHFVFRRDPMPPSPTDMSFASNLVVVCVVVSVGFVVLLPTIHAPIGWDARSIWWMHANWLRLGGATYARAMNTTFLRDPLHVDYPTLNSGLVALTWAIVRSGRDLWFAQAASATATFGAVVLSWCAIAERLQTSKRVASLVAVVYIVAAFGIGDKFATSGYSDLLWAGFAVAAAMWLVPRNARVDLRPMLALSACSVSKNEGLIAAVIIVVVVWRSKSWPDRVRLAAAFLPAIAWSAVASAHGAKSDILVGLQHAKLANLLRRIGPSIEAIGAWTFPYLVVFVILVVLHRSGIAHRQVDDRPSDDDASVIAIRLGLVAALVAASVWFVYVVSPHPLEWHLDTSVSRTTMVIRLLLLAAAIVIVLGQRRAQMTGEHEPRPVLPDQTHRNER